MPCDFGVSSCMICNPKISRHSILLKNLGMILSMVHQETTIIRSSFMFINVCHIQMYMNSRFKVDAPHALITNINDGWAMKPLKTRFGFKLSHQRSKKILGLRAFHARLNGTALLALHYQFLAPSFFLIFFGRHFGCCLSLEPI